MPNPIGNVEEKMRLVVIIYLLFQVLAIQLCNAQVSTEMPIGIFVFDTENSKAISEVYLTNIGQSFSVVSDSKGFIDLTTLKSTTELRTQHPSYQENAFIWKQEIKSGDTVFLEKKVIDVGEVIVKISRLEEKAENIFEDLSIIPAATVVIETQPATAADLLLESGKVFVQKSQQGGGSPVLRGFEASRVLLMVDGVRMNNAIYRSGHLQNSITIDPSILESVEITYGPGSLLHGSDALGGVVHYKSKDPRISPNGKTQFSAALNTWYASASSEFSFHSHASVGGKKWAGLASYSRRAYGDLTIGKNRSEDEPEWGLRPEYIERVNGRDSIIQNANPSVMRFTKFEQSDFLGKLRFRPNDVFDFNLNVQSSNSSNIPRFDRLNDYRDGLLRFAEWNYGPQKRNLLSFNVRWSAGNKLFDKSVLSLAYQNIEESRITRNYQSALRSSQIEQLWAANLNLDFRKEISERIIFQYGIEYWFNDLNSSASEINIEEEEASPVRTASRYPDGITEMHSSAAFASMRWFPTDRWKYALGLRYNRIGITANYAAGTVQDIPFEGIEGSNQALTLSAGAKFLYNDWGNFSLNLSNGFRAPNIDDVGKLFDPFTGGVVVPNADVNPEQSYSVDLQWEHDFSDKLRIETDFFYSQIRDLLRRLPFQIEGQDSIEFEGVSSQILANQNSAKAIITGCSAQVKWQISDDLSLQKSLAYTYGRDTESNTPLGHIPPFFGQAGLKWERGAFKTKLSYIYNLKKGIDQYSPFSEDKLDEATSDGTPFWDRWDMSFNYQFKQAEFDRKLSLNVICENLFDLHYRPFSSGISAPGRNIKLGIAYSF